MTEAQLVAKKLALIEQYVGEIRRHVRPGDMPQDIVLARFAQYTLQMAIQAALDVASHVVSDDRLGEPRTNAELFSLLAGAGWIDQDLAKVMRRVVGFRNVVVHQYADVDPAVVQGIIESGLDDLLTFVKTLRARLPGADSGS